MANSKMGEAAEWGCLGIRLLGAVVVGVVGLLAAIIMVPVMIFIIFALFVMIL